MSSRGRKLATASPRLITEPALISVRALRRRSLRAPASCSAFVLAGESARRLAAANKANGSARENCCWAQHQIGRDVLHSATEVSAIHQRAAGAVTATPATRPMTAARRAAWACNPSSSSSIASAKSQPAAEWPLHV